MGTSAALPAGRFSAILNSADGIVTHAARAFRRDSFGRTFLRPMARLMTAELRRYPNHFLAVLIDRAIGFGGHLPGDIHSRAHSHLQGHASAGELFSGNGVGGDLLRSRGKDDRVVIAFHGRTR